MEGRGAGALRDLAVAGLESGKETFSYYSKSGKDERRLVGASFFMGVVAAAYWYIIILYLHALEFGSVEIGLIFGIGTVVSIFALLISGVLADRFGRKKLLILGLIGDAVGLAMFLSEKNFVVFVAASSVANFSASLIQPSLMALLAGKTTSSKVKYLLGLQSFSNQMGITIAALLGMYLPGLFDIDPSTGYWYVILATVAMGVVPVILTAFTSDTRTDGSQPTLRDMIRSFNPKIRRALVMFSAQNALIGMGAGILIPWLPLVFQEGLGATDGELAAIFALSNLVLAFGWFVVPKFAEFRGSVLLVAVCQTASIGFLLGIPYAPLLAIAAFFYIMRNLLMLVPVPVLNAYVMNIAPENIRATFFALGTLAWTIPFAVAEGISGYLWADDYTKVLPFYLCAAMYIAGTLVFYLYFRNISEPVEDAVPARQTRRTV